MLHRCHSRAGPSASLTGEASRWETSGMELSLSLSQGFLVSLKYAYSVHFPHYLVLHIVQPPGDSRPYLCHPSTVDEQAGATAAQGGEVRKGKALAWHSLSAAPPHEPRVQCRNRSPRQGAIQASLQLRQEPQDGAPCGTSSAPSCSCQKWSRRPKLTLFPWRPSKQHPPSSASSLVLPSSTL